MADTSVALVLAGGVALGAYQAGAYEAIPDDLRRRTGWIAGSSIGAVNGAIIAGNPPGERVRALGRFWDELARAGPVPATRPMRDGLWAKPLSWFDVAATRMLGRTGLFSPQPLSAAGSALGLYRLDGLREALRRHVDFDRLNGGEMRLSVVATDLATGERVVFDTGLGDAIAPEHILASCGFLPDFEPTAIGGRLLGDGALCANAPVEVVLGAPREDHDLVLFVIDLFARDVGPPRSIRAANELRRDLLLASPTHRALDLLEREDDVRRQLAAALGRVPAQTPPDPDLARAAQSARSGAITVLHLSVLAAPAEAGTENQFDFSRASIARRREAGGADMIAALRHLETEGGAGGWTRVAVRRGSEGA